MWANLLQPELRPSHLKLHSVRNQDYNLLSRYNQHSKSHLVSVSYKLPLKHLTLQPHKHKTLKQQVNSPRPRQYHFLQLLHRPRS